MKGTHKVVVSSKRVSFRFDVRRNITVIRGDSATGKTTLVGLVRDYENNGAQSGVSISCDKRCRVLEGADWKARLKLMKDSIVFIDEGNAFVESDEFAKAIKSTDNYYVLITRARLSNLPYSVEEVFELKRSGRKIYKLSPFYKDRYESHINITDLMASNLPTDIIMTEDYRSGYQFFSHVAKLEGVRCVSAKSKSKILASLDKHVGKRVLVIADGSAFGSEIDLLAAYQTHRNKQVVLYLPESFEWLLLRSGILHEASLRSILDNPQDYIESKEYMSWEQYFAKLLTHLTQDIPSLKYSKAKLAPGYLEPRNIALVEAAMRGSD